MAATFQTLANIYSDVRYNAGKDSTTLVDADLLRIANKYFGLIVRGLVDINEDLYAEIATTDLVANQKEYPLPTDSASTYGGGLIKVLRTEVSYDATNWYRALPVNLDNQKQSIYGSSVATINQEFSKSAPKYAIFDRSLWLLPVPESTDAVSPGNAGLISFWVKRPNEMTATTDIPEMPKDFLSILTEGMLIDVYRKYDKVAQADRARLNFNNMLAQAKLSETNIDEPVVLKSATDICDYK